MALALAAWVAAACSQRPDAEPSARTVTQTATPTPSASTTLRVTHPTVWLCRPGLPHDPCAATFVATVVHGDGSRTREVLRPAKDPAVDCFYVYPTVSPASSVNAPLRAGPAEVAVARAQAAMFSGVCRVFAPVYRQLTLKALLEGRFGDRAAREIAHADVVSAWHDYLMRDNNGRRFVLLGHSQGSFELIRLVQEEIDGNAALRGRMLSALLIGGRVTVPPGRDVGGDFAFVPACRDRHQTGCVVAYNSFDQVPPADSWFGRPSGGREVLCVNPAAPSGGTARLHPYLPGARLPGYSTDFVAFPDAVSAQCQRHDGVNWLQVDVSPHAGAPALRPALGPEWGLHAADVSVALGDLVSLVAAQAGSAPR